MHVCYSTISANNIHALLTLWSRHTISTSEMASKLSTWTSTPTGTAGPRKAGSRLDALDYKDALTCNWQECCLKTQQWTVRIQTSTLCLTWNCLDYVCLFGGCDSFLCQSFCFKQWLLLSFIQIPIKAAGGRFPPKWHRASGVSTLILTDIIVKAAFLRLFLNRASDSLPFQNDKSKSGRIFWILHRRRTTVSVNNFLVQSTVKVLPSHDLIYGITFFKRITTLMLKIVLVLPSSGCCRLSPPNWIE